ncbi:MAG TPA: hypothetical protein VEZ11_10990 [Thermoanaerobaculia bacterium]|nr:hypothetical protein [Thermoanaerobaculia bacterium]
MPIVHLSADEQLLAALRPPPRHRWDTESSLRVIQMLALVIAGLWAYYMYLKKGSIEVDRLAQTPVATTEDLRVKPLSDAPGWYYVEYVYTFTNTGNKAITIDSLMAEAFVARTPAVYGTAPLLINDVADPGILPWRCVSRRGFKSPSTWSPTDRRIVSGDDEAPAERGGGGTGVMNAGEHLDGIIAVLVPGRPTDFVGFRVQYAINSGRNKVDQQRLREFAALGLITEQRR